MQQALTSPPRPARPAAAAAAASPPVVAKAAVARRRCFSTATAAAGGADAAAPALSGSATTTAVLDLLEVLEEIAPLNNNSKDQDAPALGRRPPRVPAWLDTPLLASADDEQAAAAAGNDAAAARSTDPSTERPTTRKPPPPPYPTGTIELLTGPMFSGKSTALLERVRQLSAEGRNVAVVKPPLDARYARHMVVSHSGKAARCFVVSRLSDLPALLGEQAWRDLDAVAVDEAQFFPDLVEFALAACEAAAGAEGGSAGAGRGAAGAAMPAAPLPSPQPRPKVVVVAGLSGDFQRRPFGRVAELLPLADRVRALRAVCFACGADAPFSLRLQQQQHQRDEAGEDTEGSAAAAAGAAAQVLVGGQEAYQPACRACFVRHSSHHRRRGVAAAAR
jgi:thymidine kinase